MFKQFTRSFRYGQKGFTLIELLIVIAILAVLAAVVVPNVQRFTKSGQKAAAQQEMQTVQTAADAGMAEAGSITLDAALVVGPTDNPDGLYEIVDDTSGASGVFLGDFLRREINGTWTVGIDGVITGGHYKDSVAGWTYTAGPPVTWVWETPAP